MRTIRKLKLGSRKWNVENQSSKLGHRQSKIEKRDFKNFQFLCTIPAVRVIFLHFKNELYSLIYLCTQIRFLLSIAAVSAVDWRCLCRRECFQQCYRICCSAARRRCYGHGWQFAGHAFCAGQ